MPNLRLPRPKQHISPDSLIRAYQAIGAHVPDSRHRANRMAALLGVPVEHVLGAAQELGYDYQKNEPSFPSAQAIAVIKRLSTNE